MTQQATITGPTVKTCLDRIRRCDVTAAGVLADYLEEKGLPRARAVRGFWKRYVADVEYWQKCDMTRRKWTRWQCIAWAGIRLRRTMARVFGRKWARVKIADFTVWNGAK